MAEQILRRELESIFTDEKLNEYTQLQHQEMIDELHEKWLGFTREMLTEVDLMNIVIETENISHVLWSTYNHTVPLLCMLHAINEKDCARIRQMPCFYALSKDVTYLLQAVGTMKNVKLNQNITKIFGALMNRLDNLNKQQLEWLLSYQDRISENSKTFLTNLVEMIKSEMYHLNFYAPKEVEREKYLYNLYGETLKNNVKIEEIIQNLVQLYQQVEEVQNEKKACLEVNRQFIQTILDKHYDLRMHARLEPEAKMVKLGQEFKGRKNQLLTEIDEKSAAYHTFLAKNVKSFQKIVDIKFKKETNCQNWIQKYDTEASARQIVLDELREQEAKLQEQINYYKEKSLEQDEPWRIYMDAKREDIRQELYIRITNRAATRIQQWWRKHWKQILKKRKKAKKRAAKLKKKRGF